MCGVCVEWWLYILPLTLSEREVDSIRREEEIRDRCVGRVDV